MRKIIGVTVGMGLPKPDLRQTDPKKGDYVKGKEAIEAAVNDALEQAKANGEFNSVTDEHINSLIDAKLGVIENGTY